MLITFEGIEGSGKSTQVRHAAHYLKTAGHPHCVTREPGGTRIGRKIRELLLDPENTILDPMAELMLYMADRAQHVREVIAPALAEEKTVLCDRFLDATVAYQGYGRGLDMAVIHALHASILEGKAPGLTFLLDLPVAVGLARAWERIGRKSGPDRESRFEAEAHAFHEKVREGYLHLAKADPERIRVIDAASSEEAVFEQIRSILSDRLGITDARDKPCDF